MQALASVASRVADPYFRRAVELAERAGAATAPNPPVGCVVVRDGLVVGEGFHPRAGEPHAEVFALAAAGEAARGADVYVTLEPCRHHGRTPPCTEALVSAGVERVHIGLSDPSADAGGGAEQLRAAGIEVTFAEQTAPFATLVEGWQQRVRHSRPFVTVKSGISLDARVALAPDARSNITGTAGARVTRELRSRADAVVVGAHTVAIDDPGLTVRDDDGVHAQRQPLRVVLARHSVPPAHSAVFTDGLAPTLLLLADDAPATAEQAAAAVGPQVLVERYDAARGIVGALESLGARGVNDALVEAGFRLMDALWEAGTIDQLVTVTAGGMGGTSATPMYAGAVSAQGGDALEHRLAPVETGIVGDVCVVAWRPVSTLDGSTK